MKIRSLFAAVAVCGVALAGSSGTAQAGIHNIIYGYCNGMTYRAECPEGAYCWFSSHKDPCGGGTCGKVGRGLYKSGRCGGSGSVGGADYGGNGYGDYYSPTPANGMQGVPEGTVPSLEPTPAAPPAPDGREAKPRFNSPHRAVGHARIDNPSFAAGWQAYRGQNYRAALETLNAVTEAEPNNAAARYALALTQLELGNRDLANSTLAEAAAIEAKHPVANWGKLMERVQGQKRVWLEAARK